VRRVFEERWSEAPDDPEPYRFEERARLLQSELRLGEPWLDLGCGAGRFTALAPEGAIGVEIAQGALQRARRNVPGADFRLIDHDGAIPVGHGEVALVWCSEVLEHVPDALGLLQECRRVLRPGGRLLITTPGSPWWRRTERELDPLGEHVRFFTRRSLARTLGAAGFDADVRGRSRLFARSVRP
jgi:SAM-dependent methyltransferase